MTGVSLEEALDKAQEALIKANYPTMFLPLERSEKDHQGNWTLVYSWTLTNKRVRVVVGRTGQVLELGVVEQ